MSADRHPRRCAARPWSLDPERSAAPLDTAPADAAVRAPAERAQHHPVLVFDTFGPTEAAIVRYYLRRGRPFTVVR